MKKCGVAFASRSQYGEWDEFVARSPQGDVFCHTWWLDAITKSNFRILIATEDDTIVAGMPLALDSQGRANEPPLTRTLGVLYAPQAHLSPHRQASNQRRWLSGLLEHVELEDCVQMCMHHNFTDWLPFRWKGFRQTTRYTYLIEYGQMTEPDLWRNLSKGRKSSITRALNNGIRVELSDDFEQLYRYEALSYQRQGLEFRVPYRDLKPLDDAIARHGNRAIFKAADAWGRGHAMLYVAYSARSAYLLLSGSEAQYRKLGGHTLVLWEALKYFRGKACCFNFGGSDIQRIENHIRGFGGTLTPYFHVFNGCLMERGNGTRYHLGRASFHLREAWRMARNRLGGFWHRHSP